MSPGPLNLTDFDEPTSYDAVQPGKYFVTVEDAEDRETQGGENAKMPEGTPLIWVHFKVTGKVGEEEQGEDESPFYNRRFFRNLVVPPEDYDSKKRKQMNGMLVSLYRACGWTMEEITSGTFNVEAQDLIERKLIVQVNRRARKDPETKKPTGETENQVIGFFPLDSADGELPADVI